MKKGIVSITVLALILAVAIPVFALAAPAGSGVGSQSGNLLDTFSKLLGLTPAEIQAERIAGKSLAQIAESKGVTVEQLTQEALKVRKAQIEQLVSEGKITQTQADLMIKQMETRMLTNLERTTVGKPDWAGQNANGTKGQGIGSKGTNKGMNKGMGRGAGNGGFGNGGVCPYVQQ